MGDTGLMTRDEMIEVMARAIDEDPWDYTLSHSPNQCCSDCNAARSAAIERAVEVLCALEAAGYVVVPTALTEPMREAFNANYWDTVDATLDEVWTAMLSAAQQEKTDAG